MRLREVDLSRHRPSGSRDHRLKRVGRDSFRMCWTVDRYIVGSRLRWPTVTTRDTDLAGARRFAKKWGCRFPEPPRD